MDAWVLALDQGTTSSRAIVFDNKGRIAGNDQRGFRQIYPQPGWVEHDPMEIWQSVIATANAAANAAGKRISAIGIANQRETTVVWDRKTGAPVSNAIVWQCRRTADICEQLIAAGLSDYVTQKTGLLIDAYFSATKLKWILDNIPGVRQRAKNGDILFGTVDSWLIWKLTGGKVHATDYTNAARTMLFDIYALKWDEHLCHALEIPMHMLPEVMPSSGIFGNVTDSAELRTLAGVPVAGAAGDQQAALFGQACFESGMAKCTYGTGCFAVMNTGPLPKKNADRLLVTIACGLQKGKAEYALEGSIFNAGSVIQWLRDDLRLIGSAPEIDILAASVPDNGGVYFVPAFTGLGAPYWDMYARGTMLGLTRGTKRAHIARAVLESIAYQVTDLLTAMQKASGSQIFKLRVDGGASASDVLMQFQADMLRTDLDRPVNVETTALGAAFLAGLAAGVWKNKEELAELRQCDRIFVPNMDTHMRDAYYAQWQRAVARSLDWEVH